jgi:hypothetical protein
VEGKTFSTTHAASAAARCTPVDTPYTRIDSLITRNLGVLTSVLHGLVRRPPKRPKNHLEPHRISARDAQERRKTAS